MSRPDPHSNDFDHNLQREGRGNPLDQIQGGPRDYGAHLRDLPSRESSRDFSSRDFITSTAYYHPSPPPPSNPADRRSLSMNPLSSSAYTPFVSPRMFNTPPGMAVSSGESWSSKPANFPPSQPGHKSSPSDVGHSAGPGQLGNSQIQPSHPSLVLNPHRPPSSARGASIPELFNSSISPATNPTERDVRDARELYSNFRQLQQQASPSTQVPPPFAQPAPSSSTTASPRSTLWWGELEPWMDEEYAKQVCNLMGWDPVNIKVPRPAPDPITGQQANNPGYCFLTFPSQAHAASVLSQANNGSGASLIMPNSSKPFSLNWAPSVPPSTPVAATLPNQVISIPGAQNPQYPKEYSIFVGDLAPEVSNSDLVAVFRNPVLGLRNDREPRFIRPFLSCKSAKIMLDPVTGVSRGYGFVRYVYCSKFCINFDDEPWSRRFTDEADQQRALIEMHGLYCLSRPSKSTMYETPSSSLMKSFSAHLACDGKVQAWTWCGGH